MEICICIPYLIEIWVYFSMFDIMWLELQSMAQHANFKLYSSFIQMNKCFTYVSLKERQIDFSLCIVLEGIALDSKSHKNMVDITSHFIP